MYNQNKVFIAACAGMGFFGVAMLSLGPILSQLNGLVAGANSLPTTMSIGIILGTIIFGPVVERCGYKWLLVAASAMVLLGLQGLSNFTEMGMLHAAMFSLGVGGGILNGETNALVAEIYDDSRRGGRLGILGAFYCIGALTWTLLNYYIPAYKLPLEAMSALMALCIVGFCLMSFPKAKAQAQSGPKPSLASSASLLKYPVLIAFAMVLFFQSGFEGITGSFTISFLTLTSDLDQASATLSMTFFTIGMLCGRLPLGLIMARLRDLGTLYLYLGVALTGVIFLYALQSSAGVYTALTLIGFGAGATFPVIINYIAATFGSQAPSALSIAMFVGLCGQPTFNKTAGWAFDLGNPGLLPVLMVTAVLAMMAIVPVAVKLSSRTAARAV